MDRLRRAALITRLVQELRQHQSWCGETHIQKASMLLQEMMDVPLGFEFILYKHGPFSFDLRDELTGMRADNLLSLESQYRYGPRYDATEQSRYIQGLFAKTVEANDAKISFVAQKLGRMGVAELERLATAFYITKNIPGDGSVQGRAQALTDCKPHIPPEIAITAIEAADQLIEEARLVCAH